MRDPERLWHPPQRLKVPTPLARARSAFRNDTCASAPAEYRRWAESRYEALIVRVHMGPAPPGMDACGRNPIP
jgi:hypothetical protein